MLVLGPLRMLSESVVTMVPITVSPTPGLDGWLGCDGAGAGALPVLRYSANAQPAVPLYTTERNPPDAWPVRLTAAPLGITVIMLLPVLGPVRRLRGSVLT